MEENYTLLCTVYDSLFLYEHNQTSRRDAKQFPGLKIISFTKKFKHHLYLGSLARSTANHIDKKIETSF
jgi:hypothetical protein